jgi:hypothetical protein
MEASMAFTQDWYNATGWQISFPINRLSKGSCLNFGLTGISETIHAVTLPTTQ